jgi:hypothetical protein
MVFTYEHGRFVVSTFEFTRGGDGDVYCCDFVRDPRQGFGVPAKSMSIQNHGGGAGDNLIYYRTTYDGSKFSKTMILYPDMFVNYYLGETIFYGVLVWASNANCRFSLDATPGEWTEKEAAKYISDPIVKKVIDYISGAQEDLLSLGGI